MRTLDATWYSKWGLVDIPAIPQSLFQKNTEFEHLYWNALPLPTRYDLLTYAIENFRGPGEIKTTFQLSSNELRELFQLYEQYNQEMVYVTQILRATSRRATVAEIADRVGIPLQACALLINKYLLATDPTTRKQIVTYLATLATEIPPDRQFVRVKQDDGKSIRAPATIPQRYIADAIAAGRSICEIASTFKILPALVVGYLDHYELPHPPMGDTPEDAPDTPPEPKRGRGRPRIRVDDATVASIIALTRRNPRITAREIHETILSASGEHIPVYRIRDILAEHGIKLKQGPRAGQTPPAPTPPPAAAGRRPTPPEVVARVIDLLETNEYSADEIGALVGISGTTVRNLKKQHSIRTVPKTESCILREFNNGLSIPDIATTCDCTVTYARQILRKHNIDFQRVHTSMSAEEIACVTDLVSCGYVLSQITSVTGRQRQTLVANVPATRKIPAYARATREHPFRDMTTAIDAMTHGVPFDEILDGLKITQNALLYIMRTTGHTFPAAYIPTTRGKLANLLRTRDRAEVAEHFNVTPATVKMWEGALEVRAKPPAGGEKTVIGMDRLRQSLGLRG